MATNPYNGSSSSTYFVKEVTPGVTPTSPEWTPLRNTGGIPTIQKDTLQSEELDKSREIKSIRTGNEQATGEFTTELSYGSHDELYANAMTSDWVDGLSLPAIEITVDDVAKTFTRTAGDNISDGIEVGQLVVYPDLTGNNANPFIVTAVTALVVTGAGITLPLSVETVTTDMTTGDYLGTGNLCKTMSIMTELVGKCGTVSSYLITTGVEMTGWSLEVAVNAQVTGSFPVIGRNQETLSAPPSGSTFLDPTSTRPYTGVDGKLLSGGELKGGVTTIVYTNDNNAAPQYVLGDKAVSFVSRGTANNTVSASSFMSDTTDLNKFLDEEIISIAVILNHPDGGAMSFTTPRTVLTAAPIELGAEDVTIALEGTAIGTQNQSSMLIQRLG